MVFPGTNLPFFSLFCITINILITVIENLSHRLGEFLGSGQFGTVYKGDWKTSTKPGLGKVAVKTLHANSHIDDKVRFLQEAAIMAQFNHVNVIRLFGLVIENEPVRLAGW